METQPSEPVHSRVMLPLNDNNQVGLFYQFMSMGGSKKFKTGGGANLDIAYTFCGKTLTKISTLEEEFFKNWKTVLKSFNKDSTAASDMEYIDCQSINIVQINRAKIVLQSLTDTTSFFVSHLYINIKNRFCYIITYIATILF